MTIEELKIFALHFDFLLLINNTWIFFLSIFLMSCLKIINGVIYFSKEKMEQKAKCHAYEAFDEISQRNVGCFIEFFYLFSICCSCSLKSSDMSRDIEWGIKNESEHTTKACKISYEAR